MQAVGATTGQISRDVEVLGYSAQGPYVLYQSPFYASGPQVVQAFKIPIPLPITAYACVGLDILQSVCSPSNSGYWAVIQAFVCIQFNAGAVTFTVSTKNGGVNPTPNAWISTMAITSTNATATTPATIQGNITVYNYDVSGVVQIWTNISSNSFVPGVVL